MIPTQTMLQLVREVQRQAATGVWTGKDDAGDRLYFNGCRWQCEETDSILIYTRDFGERTVGRWQSTLVKRCAHLVLAVRDGHGGYLPRDQDLHATWIELFFMPYQNWLWCEPARTGDGVNADCWHYRLYCQPNWRPLLPEESRSLDFARAGLTLWPDVVAAAAPQEN